MSVAVQSVFPAMQAQVGTLFVPTPGIEECHNYWLVQKMLESRIRSIMTSTPFENPARYLVEVYLTPPPHMSQAKDIQRFYETEAQELYASFANYEQSPSFQDALNTLVPYKGKTFSISSVTTVGLQLIIDLGEG